MPKFTPNDSTLWFSIVDRKFQAAGITVDEIWLRVNGNYAMEVRDVIMNPSAEHVYKTLKTELLK